jgi:four helix bundle protein
MMSNSAEGFAHKSDREFTHFLFITKGPCAEVQSLLYGALDQRHMTQEDFQQLYTQADKVAKLTSGLISYLFFSETKRLLTQHSTTLKTLHT